MMTIIIIVVVGGGGGGGGVVKKLWVFYDVRRVDWQTLTDVSEECGAFIFWDCWTLKKEALIFETSVTICQSERR